MTSLKTPQPWPIIDVHAHVRPPWWKHEIPSHASPADAAWFDRWGRKLTNPSLLVKESEEGDITLRLLSAPIEGIFGISGPTDLAEIRRHNDYLARLVEDYPGRLAALATIDAYSGKLGAREVERAVIKLGHVGIVVDSARGDLFPGSAESRPTFEAAAALNVPVLVHPVSPPNADTLVAAAGRPGNTFGRGYVNGAAFLSILRSGLLDDLPDLHVLFAGIGVGAVAIAAAELPQYSIEARRERRPRPNAYFDFMGLDPATLRFVVDVLGAERVVVGSDWPIWAPVTRAALTAAFDGAGIPEPQRALIAGGNAERLLDMQLCKYMRAAV